MKIALASDHAGYDLKLGVAEYLLSENIPFEDFGCGPVESADYVDLGAKAARSVVEGACDRAIMVCGTGLGMAIVANKVRGVRAAPVTDPYSAERAIKSNDARVLCLGSLVVGVNVAPLLVDHWLEGGFAGGRSGRKVAKIEDLDRREGGTSS